MWLLDRDQPDGGDDAAGHHEFVEEGHGGLLGVATERRGR